MSTLGIFYDIVQHSNVQDLRQEMVAELPSLETNAFSDDVQSNLGNNNSKTSTSTSNIFVISDKVTEAEIIWSITSLINHHSMLSAGSIASLFKIMFPDSTIASIVSRSNQNVLFNLIWTCSIFQEAA
jgi:hypothetical protein